MIQHRRSRTDIITDILAIAMEGTLKTHIMNRANLSYAQLKKYLALLQKEGLLETRKEKGWTIYATTKKGNELLQKISKNKEELSRHPPIIHWLKKVEKVTVTET